MGLEHVAHTVQDLVVVVATTVVVEVIPVDLAVQVQVVLLI